ncbi:hypothetical protein EUGRSUZ_J01783 [Eucalyptus grandis]|uniref:Uncharacterized protein n=2 Tax=Eucalyptus grandis TaxID=71139 RepID=A0ACC3J643_EUCGR|nr:hypothetical protein EUGRSUZ_J01783 [Eucalyptus grandis]
MSERKYEIEKFNGSNNFVLWSIKMRALLILQCLAKALDGKDELPIIMKASKRIELMERVKSTILLNLSDEILIEVAEEKDAAMLWAKL